MFYWFFNPCQIASYQLKTRCEFRNCVNSNFRHCQWNYNCFSLLSVARTDAQNLLGTWKIRSCQRCTIADRELTHTEDLRTLSQRAPSAAVWQVCVRFLCCLLQSSLCSECTKDCCEFKNISFPYTRRGRVSGVLLQSLTEFWSEISPKHKSNLPVRDVFLCCHVLRTVWEIVFNLDVCLTNCGDGLYCKKNKNAKNGSQSPYSFYKLQNWKKLLF